MRAKARQRSISFGKAAVAVIMLAALGFALALGHARSASAQAVRPPANAVTPAEMGQGPRDVDIGRYKATWGQVRRGVVGNVEIPDKREAVLVQATGQVWRGLHTGPVVRWSGYGLVAIVVVLAVYYLWHGSIKIEHGRSGRLIERFTALDRFAHWLAASTFIVLALTGLNMLFGRLLFLKGPGVISIGANFSGGQDFYAALTHWGKVAHDYASWGFIVGLILMFVLWVGENLPTRSDLVWLAKAGGLFSRGVHLPAPKINAGQKMLFWGVIIFGGSLAYSGLCLLFPFQILPWSYTFKALNLLGLGLPTDLLPVQEMQLTQLWHGIVAVCVIAALIAHTYIGTLGMEGAFEAMGTGMVDENWARQHHAQWAEEVEREAAEGAKGGHAQPAE